MKKAISLSESDLAKIIQNAVEKKLQEMKSNSSLHEAEDDYKDRSMYDPYYGDEDEEDDDPNTVATFPVDDPYFELSDSDMLDIDTYNGPKRRFRGSIYIDAMVPETDDVEYDRKVAKEMLDYHRKKLKVESYVGGVGFRTANRLDPFDMDF
jgi:hypothetical protein